MKPMLRVMKFGGTSVGDATCIARVAQIVAKAAQDSAVVAVVSAMSGVTNRLVEGASRLETGDREYTATLIESLRAQHAQAAEGLIHGAAQRKKFASRMEEVLAEGKRLCDGTALLRELTPRTLDSISSLGERLLAPLVAEA